MPQRFSADEKPYSVWYISPKEKRLNSSKKMDMQFPKIISVEATDKFKLKISFNDGLKGIYDVSDLAGKGVFKSWDQIGNFNKVFINKESGAISWPGEIEIDTLNAYCTITNILPAWYFQNKN